MDFKFESFVGPRGTLSQVATHTGKPKLYQEILHSLTTAPCEWALTAGPV